MKKGIIAVAVLLVLASFSSPKKEAVKCQAQAKTLKIDGKADDWNANLTFDQKTGFYYAFSNDNRDLYVRLKMTNKMVQRKALATGLTLWIDPAGKGKSTLGIEYPKGRIHENRGNYQRSQNRSQGQTQRKSFSSQNNSEWIQKFNRRYLSGVEEGELKGFDKAGLKESFLGKNGIEVMLQLDAKGELIYEAKIPLNMIFVHPDEYLKSSPNAFSLAFETGYIEIDMSRMGRGGMGGGGRMGGGGQQPSGNRMAAMQFMTSSSKIKWKNVVLNSVK